MRLLVSWVLALFLVFMFVMATIYPLPNPPAGIPKLYSLPGENVVFATLAAKTGFAFFEPTGRVVVAIIELVAIVLLLVPRWRRGGALLSFFVLAAAVAAHMMPDVLGRELPVSMSDPSLGTDGGRQFTLSVAMAAASILLLMVHPVRARR